MDTEQLNVGDLVKVTSGPVHLGDYGEVFAFSEDDDHQVNVKFSVTGGCWLPRAVLEKISSTTRNMVVGDRVYICSGTSYVGYYGTIVDISAVEHSNLLILVDGYDKKVWLSQSNVKQVKLCTQDFKIGDVVEVIRNGNQGTVAKIDHEFVFIDILGGVGIGGYYPHNIRRVLPQQKYIIIRRHHYLVDSEIMAEVCDPDTWLEEEGECGQEYFVLEIKRKVSVGRIIVDEEM